MAAPAQDPELFGPPHVAVVDGPIGKVWVASDGELITRVSFTALKGRNGKAPKVLEKAAQQLDQYFHKRRKHFDLPLQQQGSRFQKLVWTAISDIPFGATRTYGAIGSQIGGKAIARTVGQACGANPLPILVPCHRVIANDGLLTGYVGGLWRKQWLLVHEGVLSKDLFEGA